MQTTISNGLRIRSNKEWIRNYGLRTTFKYYGEWVKDKYLLPTGKGQLARSNCPLGRCNGLGITYYGLGCWTPVPHGIGSTLLKQDGLLYQAAKQSKRGQSHSDIPLSKSSNLASLLTRKQSNPGRRLIQPVATGLANDLTQFADGLSDHVIG